MWIWFSISDLRITLFIVCEFRENWFPRKAHFSCGGKRSYIFRCIAKVNIAFVKSVYRDRGQTIFSPQLSIVYTQCTVHPIGILLFSSHTRPEDGPIERAETCRLLLRI